MVDEVHPASETPSAPWQSDERAAELHLRLLSAATAPDGSSEPVANSQLGRDVFREARQLLADYYPLAVDTAGYRDQLDPDDSEHFRAALAAVLLGRLRNLDTAQAGRTVTDLSVGVNALRADAPEFRTVFDELIARYMTTGRYHESHEAFVTTSLLAEQWLYAMADSTTTGHDVLDDAVSSNTRILANLGRGLAYYGELIAQLPDSSYQNVARVMHAEAEPQQLGRIVTALLTMFNRVAAADPEAQPEAYRRFASAVDPRVVGTAIDNVSTAVRAGLAANPALARTLTQSMASISWTIVKTAIGSTFRRRASA